MCGKTLCGRLSVASVCPENIKTVHSHTQTYEDTEIMLMRLLVRTGLLVRD